MEVNIKDKIFDFALREALTDATNRVYSFLSIKEKEEPQKVRDKIVQTRKNEIITASKDTIKKYIDSILESNQEDVEFYSTANTVCRDINQKLKNDVFTFGHAQKLINMTAKYLYCANYFENKRDNFKKFHCPMDSKMKNIVVKKYQEYIKKHPETTQLPYAVSWSTVSWSKLQLSRCNIDGSFLCEPYINYQIMVKELAHEKGVFPLEYDFWVWNT